MESSRSHGPCSGSGFESWFLAVWAWAGGSPTQAQPCAHSGWKSGPMGYSASCDSGQKVPFQPQTCSTALGPDHTAPAVSASKLTGCKSRAISFHCCFPAAPVTSFGHGGHSLRACGCELDLLTSKITPSWVGFILDWLSVWETL